MTTTTARPRLLLVNHSEQHTTRARLHERGYRYEFVDGDGLAAAASDGTGSTEGAPHEQEQQLQRAKRARPLLLLVDDDDDVRDVGTSWLIEAGYDVIAAGGGAAAIAALRDHDPDIVVLDLMMPVVSGWDVLDWLVAQRHDVPVIVWSAAGLRTGAVGRTPVVSKSDPDVLLNLLISLVPPNKRD